MNIGDTIPHVFGDIPGHLYRLSGIVREEKATVIDVRCFQSERIHTTEVHFHDLFVAALQTTQAPSLAFLQMIVGVTSLLLSPAFSALERSVRFSARAVVFFCLRQERVSVCRHTTTTQTYYVKSHVKRGGKRGV